MSANNVHKTHSAEFKAVPLKLANKIGITAAAKELELYESQSYN